MVSWFRGFCGFIGFIGFVVSKVSQFLRFHGLGFLGFIVFMGFVVHEFCTFVVSWFHGFCGFIGFVVSKMLRFHWFCGFKCIVVSLVSALPGLGCFMGSFVFCGFVVSFFMLLWFKWTFIRTSIFLLKINTCNCQIQVDREKKCANKKGRKYS